jgi:hypothetical protein
VVECLTSMYETTANTIKKKKKKKKKKERT